MNVSTSFIDKIISDFEEKKPRNSNSGGWYTSYGSIYKHKINKKV